MEEGKPSVTAMLVAMFRANHLLWDDPPKIFEDTLALRLSGCESGSCALSELLFSQHQTNSRVEQIFGWIKNVGGLRKPSRIARVDSMFSSHGQSTSWVRTGRQMP
jgi:hypothetical protein